MRKVLFWAILVILTASSVLGGRLDDGSGKGVTLQNSGQVNFTTNPDAAIFGGSDYLDPVSTTPQSISASSPFTCMAYVKPNTIASGQRMWLDYYFNYAAPEAGLLIGTFGSNFRLYSGTAIANGDSSTLYSAGDWTHTAVAYDGSNLEVMLNLDTVYNSSFTIQASDATGFYVGTENGASGGYEGSVTDVYCTNAYLSYTEIVSHYNNNTPSFNSSSSFYYPFAAASGTLLNNLTSYYTFDANASDSLEYLNGSVSGATNGAGFINNDYGYDGTADSITFGSSCSESWYSSTRDFSYNMWINVSAFDNNRIFRIRSNAGLVDLFPISNSTFEARAYDTAFRAAGDGSTRSTGEYYMVTVLVDWGTSVSLYIDGTLQTSTALGSNTFSCTGGVTALSDGGAFNGRIDELAVYERLLTTDEITQLYNSGAGNQYPFSVAGSNFTVTLTDEYDGSTLTNFNVTADGLTYTTTTGTVTTNISADSGTYNVEVAANGYYNKTYTNYDTVSNLAATLHQARINFTASNRVTGASITSYTASTNSNGGSTSDTNTNPSINVSEGFYNFTFNKNNYYPTTIYNANISALSNPTYNFTVYNHQLNITISTGLGTANDTYFSADLYSQDVAYHEQQDTSNGYILFNLTPGNYTIWINDSFHNLVNANITLNSTSNYTALDIDVRTANSFNITFWNETTNLPYSNITIYWEIISEEEVRNGSTDNATLYEDLLTPGSYEIIYYAEPTVRRSYFVTLNNQSSTDIRLYLISDEESNLYVPVVSDADFQACSDLQVSLLRYYIDINGYRTVEMAKTDTNGQAVLHVEPNEINYKFYFSGACGNFTTQPQKIVAATDSFTVAGSQGLLTSAEAIQGALINISYNNATQTYVFTWADNSNVVTQGCLYVYKTSRGKQTTNYSECSESNTGSLIYTLTGNLTDTTWTAQGVLDTNTEYSTYSFRGPDVSFNTSIDNWGVAGVFWGLILILGIVLISANTAGGIVFSSIGTLTVLIALGIIAGGMAVIIGLIILGLIILYKIRTS